MQIFTVCVISYLKSRIWLILFSGISCIRYIYHRVAESFYLAYYVHKQRSYKIAALMVVDFLDSLFMQAITETIVRLQSVLSMLPL